MAENTAIAWCDHTINFWWGCTKVSPACANCYAEATDARFYGGGFSRGPSLHPPETHWGSSAPRFKRITQARNEAMRYERRAANGSYTCAACGFSGVPRQRMRAGDGSALCNQCSLPVQVDFSRPRVFCSSMSDFFEDRRDLDGARLEALDVIRQTPHLDWLILTKRPESILGLLRRAEAEAPGSGLSDWLRDWLHGAAPANVWLGTTVEDQERADQRIPALLQVPAVVRFLSCEPLLGPVDLSRVGPAGRLPIDARNGGWGVPRNDGRPMDGHHGIDWVICGGESGPKARAMHPDWARSLRDQCAAAGVPFLFKQWGEWAPAMGDLWWHSLDGCPQFQTRAGGSGTHAFGDGYGAVRLGKKAAGRLLDGVEHDAFPEVAHD